MQQLSNSDSTFPQNPPAQSVNSVHEKETEASRKTNDQLVWRQKKTKRLAASNLDPPGIELLA
jgi:hypothetical protein